jgi:hypothetical protein
MGIAPARTSRRLFCAPVPITCLTSGRNYAQVALEGSESKRTPPHSPLQGPPALEALQLGGQAALKAHFRVRGCASSRVPTAFISELNDFH